MPFSFGLRDSRLAMPAIADKTELNDRGCDRGGVMSNTLPRIVALLSLFGSCTVGGAQPLSRSPAAEFRSDTNLVLIPVTVIDSRGAIVAGLGQTSFTILDNRRPQPITVFYSEDTPSSIGIVLDISGSMKGKLNLAKAAAHGFLELFNPESEFFLLTVSSNPRALSGPVGDVRQIDNLIRSAVAGGDTSLCDAILLGLRQASRQRIARRALLVISDGMDNHSRYSKAELLRAAVESDVRICTVAIGSSRAGIKGIPLAEAQGGLAFMETLAAKTGGMSTRLRNDEDPSAAVSKIAKAIRSQYVIGYQGPDADSSGRWHRVQVKVNLNRANVYARSGYQSR